MQPHSMSSANGAGERIRWSLQSVQRRRPTHQYSVIMILYLIRYEHGRILPPQHLERLTLSPRRYFRPPAQRPQICRRYGDRRAWDRRFKKGKCVHCHLWFIMADRSRYVCCCCSDLGVQREYLRPSDETPPHDLQSRAISPATLSLLGTLGTLCLGTATPPHADPPDERYVVSVPDRSEQIDYAYDGSNCTKSLRVLNGIQTIRQSWRCRRRSKRHLSGRLALISFVAVSYYCWRSLADFIQSALYTSDIMARIKSRFELF